MAEIMEDLNLIGKTDDYYLTIIEKDNSGIPEKTAFTIDIAFASDFEF